jgi:hypothetical protein
MPFEQACAAGHRWSHEPQLSRSTEKLTQTPLQLPLGQVLPPAPFVLPEPPPGPSPLPFAQLYATRKTPIIPKKPIVKRMVTFFLQRRLECNPKLSFKGPKDEVRCPVSAFCCWFAVCTENDSDEPAEALGRLGRLHVVSAPTSRAPRTPSRAEAELF